jgi:V8-like Glu-specific endopeptidase
MPQQKRFIQLPLIGKVLLGLLGSVYLVYLVIFASILPNLVPALFGNIVEHQLTTSSSSMKHWTRAAMLNATDVDQPFNVTSNLPQADSDINKENANQQQGHPPLNGDPSFPLTTVGRIFFTTGGRNSSCSGTAVESSNKSAVDTAGHCLYLYGNWAENVIFCPQYDNGNMPYGCWAARDLEIPADWLNAPANDYHHDMGIAIVAPNDEGNLTDLVGGAGWAYNQPINQPFYAYGYPAVYPFDGQTRQSCEDSSGNLWRHGAGTVVSISCNMTGGSSGGPWFIKSNGNWYLNGHNDFTSSIKYGHMFSPYYDDTWYALYDKAQHS